MKARNALTLCAVIFGIVALLHLVRALMGVSVTLGQATIPVGVSWLGFVVAAVLSYACWTAK
jgi:hypothetical protein